MMKQSATKSAEFTEEEKRKFREWCEKNKNTIFFPKKYYSAQKSMIIRKTKELFVNSPELPLRQVIIHILSNLPDFLPGDNLVKVTKYIVKTWEGEQTRKAEAA